MIIDCDGCQRRATPSCDDCVVTVLLREMPEMPLRLADEEADALHNLAAEGLVPRLRLAQPDRDAG